jgi:transposase
MRTAIHTTTKRTLWTPDHDDILKERFHTDCLHDIASHIGCTCSTVSDHARRLGLKKISPSGRNSDARSFVLIEYPNLSYQEMAERTGLHRETIRIIARELGLERTPEQLRKIRSRRRKELIQKERRRIIFGLDQKTNIKVVSNHQKIRLRGSLKRLGYIIGTDGHTFYYYPGLRRHPIKESNGRALGFTFLPLPTACTEETIHDSASPAVSVNGQTIN